MLLTVAQLKKLSDPDGHEAVDTAQRFLTSAYEAVDAVLETLDTVRQVRKQKGGDIRGRLTAPEEDLLRAAVVFTGAGLDSVLKQLIRDTLPALLATNDQAHEKFETFARDRIGTGEIADSAMIARYLTSENPRDRLIEDYIYELTGSSLQSADEVQKVAGALGVDNAGLRKRIKGLRDLFVARNEISHELDLQRPEQHGDRTRRSRAMKPTKALCHEGLEIGQLMINQVVKQL